MDGAVTDSVAATELLPRGELVVKIRMELLVLKISMRLLNLAIAAMAEGLHLGRREAALGLVEVPANDIRIPDEIDRVALPVRVEEARWNVAYGDVRRPRRAIAIPAV